MEKLIVATFFMIFAYAAPFVAICIWHFIDNLLLPLTGIITIALLLFALEQITHHRVTKGTKESRHRC